MIKIAVASLVAFYNCYGNKTKIDTHSYEKNKQFSKVEARQK